MRDRTRRLDGPKCGNEFNMKVKSARKGPFATPGASCIIQASIWWQALTRIYMYTGVIPRDKIAFVLRFFVRVVSSTRKTDESRPTLLSIPPMSKSCYSSPTNKRTLQFIATKKIYQEGWRGEAPTYDECKKKEEENKQRGRKKAWFIEHNRLWIMPSWNSNN